MQNNKKILWIDDEIDLLESHIIYLTDKGYLVETSNSGEDAIDYCSKNAVDLVLLDEMMTGIDGIETLKRLKDMNPDLPVIMVTKNEEETIKNQCVSSGTSFQETLDKASKTISGLSNYAGIVVAPKFQNNIKHIEFIIYTS